MTTRQIALTDAEARRLEALARRRRVPEDSLLREAVERLLAGEPQVDDEQIWRKARSIVGMASSGIPDLSERHDDYFVEAIES